VYFVYVKNLGLRDVKVLGECYETVRKIVSAMHFSYCKGALKVWYVEKTSIAKCVYKCDNCDNRLLKKKTNIRNISKAYLLNSFENFNIKDEEKMFENHHKIVVKGLRIYQYNLLILVN